MRDQISDARLSMRRAWLRSGVDNATILDILVSKDIRYLTRDVSMAEVLEDVVLFNRDEPAPLEWYEQAYLEFIRKVNHDSPDV